LSLRRRLNIIDPSGHVTIMWKGAEMPGTRVVVRELRAEFLTASAIPVLLAGAVAHYETALFDWPLFLLTLFGAAFLHIGTNVINDYFDHLSGNDPVNVRYIRPFTGGSRLIQNRLLTPKAVLTIAIAFYAAAAVIGAIITVIKGPVIMLLGLAGLVSGYFYTGPPIRFAHRGLGEIVVGLNFGLLIGIGTYFVQTGTVTRTAVVSSLPLTLLVAAIIIINEFQDSEADARVGKRTLVVRLGLRRSVPLFAVVSLAAFIPIVIGVRMGLFPPFAMLGLVPLPIVAAAILRAQSYYDSPKKLAPANAAAILSHALTGILLAGGFLLGG
jgi:1,4-dihydroxy-2-naphthoate octaprenyltransferase